MTGEENWYIIFCKEEKKEILDNMRGRSRKRSIRNVREKALLAAILEYELTDLGRTLIPILNQLSEWGRNNLKEVKRNLTKWS